MSNLTVPSKQRGLDIYPDDDSAYTFEITVRFSASLPDLQISIPSNNGPTTATLKQRIRNSLPEDLQNKRIRLIYAGKALDDATPLSTSLKRLVTRPPSRVATPGPYDSGAESDTTRTQGKDKAKGKQPVRDPPAPPAARVYIHCSIGDVTLSPEDLATETRLASTSTSTATQPQSTQGQSQLQDRDTSQHATTTSTTPAPRGFDRLLTAGFSPAEILALRQQFLSIQAHTHTPDTMPSPSALRTLEDQWLDNSNTTSLSLDAADGAGAGAGDADADADAGRGALDDMIWGTTVGFFWPVGCLVWGVREEGIFSPRRKIAVVIGVVLNLGLGFVRWGG